MGSGSGGMGQSGIGNGNGIGGGPAMQKFNTIFLCLNLFSKLNCVFLNFGSSDFIRAMVLIFPFLAQGCIHCPDAAGQDEPNV